MKRVPFFAVLGCVFMLSTASMCSSDDNSTHVDTSAVTNTVMQGTWRVTQFSEDSEVHTTDFTGYNFTFAASNVLTAINGSITNTGFWSVTSDDSDDDNSSNDIDFNIVFTSPANFSELSEDWHILERTSTKLRLQHVSGGNGGTDLLTFEKN